MWSADCCFRWCVRWAVLASLLGQLPLPANPSARALLLLLLLMLPSAQIERFHRVALAPLTLRPSISDLGSDSFA